MPYNILTCRGFLDSASTGLNFGPCFSARVGLVILFFLIAIIRKWGGEEIGIDFNFWFSFIAGVLVYFIVITITGNSKASFGIGLVAAVVMGYGSGYFFGGSEDGY